MKTERLPNCRAAKATGSVASMVPNTKVEAGSVAQAAWLARDWPTIPPVAKTTVALAPARPLAMARIRAFRRAMRSPAGKETEAVVMELF
jgi:hypothetical protein